ncbi:cytochrome P450 [Obba rivulosa]|uniref:Cytochrome P450 n=1 Tax=Obba rivulosa TaxID=1052685 RepID=A0A8E2DRP2_9APHY|nr:cytochrome P450 [Obba rivulosa]
MHTSLSLTSYLGLALGALILYASFTRLFLAKSRLPPPGPPAKPLFGNILDVMPKENWSELIKHRRHGDLAFFHGFGKNMLVVNSLSDIRDLFEKRAETYGARPWFTVACEVFGGGESMSFRACDDGWRAQRKMIHFGLSPMAVKQYATVQEDVAALLAKDFLETPEEFFHHVRQAVSRMILAITYGFDVKTSENGYIQDAEYVIKTLSEACEPGAYLVEFIPFLQHVPTWIPLFRKMNSRRDCVTILTSTSAISRLIRPKPYHPPPSVSTLTVTGPDASTTALRSRGED